MPLALPDLEAFFAPLGVERFFADVYETAPLHLPAPADHPISLLTHTALLEALRDRGGAPEGVVWFPEHAGTTAEALAGDPSRLTAYLDEGHPLVWNRARGIWPSIDAAASLIAEAFGAQVWPNVYATGDAGTPFDIHFDSHEVLAVQCEGEKDWTISEVRVDRPLDAAEMEPAIEAAQRSRRDEAAARTALEFTARPGDRVYVPRGQFHQARARGGRSLHVTFGIRLPSGYEIARQILLEMLADPRMRDYLPPRLADRDGALEARLADDVASRVQSAARPSAVLEMANALRARWIARRPRNGG